MKTLVIGGAGFIGSHLVDRLLEDGHEVVVIDSYSTGRLEKISHTKNHPRLWVHEADVVDHESITPLFEGVTWVFHKEDCPDLRNTKVVEIIEELKSYNVQIDVYDPWIDKTEALLEYGITTITEPLPNTYEAVVIAVAHDQFKIMGTVKNRSFTSPVHIIYDLKYVVDKTSTNLLL